MADKRITTYPVVDFEDENTRVLGVKNGQVKLVQMGDLKSVTANPSATTTDTLSSIEIGGVNYSISGGGNFDVDNQKKWLLISDSGHNYYAPLTEIVAPNKPTIATTTYYVVVGNVSVSVSAESGATVQYSLNGGTTWQNGSTITIASGFNNDTNNVTKTQSVQVKALKNGLESGVNTYTITINPKVKAGSISFTRNDDNDDYSTMATITMTASDMSGTTSRYTNDGGTTWTAFTGTRTETTSESKPAGQYRVKIDSVTGYQDAAVAQTSAITLNRQKFYWGTGGATLANEAAIKGLLNGGSQKTDIQGGFYDVTVTEQTTGSYIWFCGLGTITMVKAGGFGVPMESVVVVDGYNCYRSTPAQVVAGTTTFEVIV